LNAIARFAIARPKHVMAACFLLIGVLGAIGLHLEKDLHQKSDLVIPGSTFDRADQLTKQRFGDSVTFTVLLKGPARSLDVQGPVLTGALERQGMSVLSPWRLQDPTALRPKPGAAVLIVHVPGTFEHAAVKVVPHARQVVDRMVHAPVHPYLTGDPDVSEGAHLASVKAVERAEMLAIPLLMLILLLVFRSPVAAALPLVVATGTIGASRGVLDLINRGTPLDDIALNLNAMMGLALGVDYALLMVSRFREELRAGLTPEEAALKSVSTAGRTVLFAGIAIATAMFAALESAPGSLLLSSSVGICIAAVFSVVGALTALPATLVLLGDRINKFTIGGATGNDSRFGLLALRALRRPVLASALVIGLIALMALPAIAIDIGPASALVLPKNSRQHKDFVEFQKTLGTGWTAPYEVIVATRSGPITDGRRLQALAAFQERLSGRKDVTAVMGPGEIAQQASPLESVGAQLSQANGQLTNAINDQTRLKGGLNSAAGGADQLRSGLSSASAGAAALSAGGSKAASGAQQLTGGIAQARAGAQRMQAGLASAGSGAKALQAGAGRARGGLAQVKSGLAQAQSKERAGAPQVDKLANALDQGGQQLGKLRDPVQNADDNLVKAWTLVNNMTTGKADFQYKDLATAIGTAYGAMKGKDPRNGKPVQDGYDGLDAALAQAQHESGQAADGVRQIGSQLGKLDSGLSQLQNGAGKLEGGAGQLQAGLAKLSAGLDRLGGGGSQLSNGLAQLENAGGQLAAGTRRLQGGAGQLEQGLASGAGRTGALTNGLGQMEQGVASGVNKTKQLGSGLGKTRQLGAITSSGYAALAAIDSGSPTRKRLASFALNLDRGGNAVRFVVIGKGAVSRWGHPLRPVLSAAAADLARQTGTDARLGGSATRLQDYEHTLKGRFWVLMLILGLVAYLVLMPLLRSVVLPLLAIGLTALTVAAAMGVLVLLFQGHPPLLGGAGWLDATIVFGIYTIAFALSIDYQVFLLTRMREGWQLTGNTNEAIGYGLRRTAGVVTGAAMSMTGVFVAFALTDVVILKQLGVGLTVAVLLDATLVRLVLLPAAMRLLGDRCWWMPAWLERTLDPAPRRVPRTAPASAATPSPIGARGS
jgi:RND superfamily putative drug exporter